MKVNKQFRALYLFFLVVIVLVTASSYFSRNGWMDFSEVAILYGSILLFLLNIIFSIISYFNKDKILFIISITIVIIVALLVIFPICRYIYEQRCTAYAQANAIQFQGLEKINFTDGRFAQVDENYNNYDEEEESIKIGDLNLKSIRINDNNSFRKLYIIKDGKEILITDSYEAFGGYTLIGNKLIFLKDSPQITQKEYCAYDIDKNTVDKIMLYSSGTCDLTVEKIDNKLIFRAGWAAVFKDYIIDLKTNKRNIKLDY